MVDITKSLPGFLSKNGNHAASPPDTAIAKANELGNVVSALIAERDKLRETVEFQRQHIETLSGQLTLAERDRDTYMGKAEFYERFSMAIATNFNTIRMIIDDTQRKADRLAKTGGEAPQPEPDAIQKVELSLDDIIKEGQS